MEMYKYWKQSFASPVQDIVEAASLSYINKTEVSDSEALGIMEELSAFPKSYNALQVVLFSCPDDNELVEKKYESIVAQWKSAT
ncbi:hypothetical protein [Pseudoalteromonas gelatinilytica]